MIKARTWFSAVALSALIALSPGGIGAAHTAATSPAAAKEIKKLKAKAKRKTIKAVKNAVVAAPGEPELAAPTTPAEIKVSSCKPVRKNGRSTSLTCSWSAKGELPGIVPFRCEGRSRFSVKKKKLTKVDACRNALDPQAPLLATPHDILFGYFESFDLHADLYDELRASGAQIAKLQLTWRALQPSQSTFNWGLYDQIYNQLIAAGVRPVITFGEAPCWAAPSGPCDPTATHPVDASHVQDYADTAAQIATRYPMSAAIEVWLEPNGARFWGAEPDPPLFSDLVGATATSVAATGTGIRVISGGLVPGTANDKMEMGAFLSAALARGGIQAADGIGFHAVADVPFVAGTELTRGYLGRMRIQVQLLSKLLGEAGVSKPLEITQLSFSTAGPTGYTEAQQAEALVSSLGVLGRINGVGLVIVSKLLDTGDGSKVEGFGVLRNNRTPKPAFCRLAATRGVPAPAGC